MLLWNTLFCWYPFYLLRTTPPSDKPNAIEAVIGLGLCVAPATWLLAPVALFKVWKRSVDLPSSQQLRTRLTASLIFLGILSPLWIHISIFSRTR